MEEVSGGVRNESPVISDHAEKSLQFLDGGGRRGLLYGRHSVLERRDSGRIDLIAEELQRALAEDALVALDHHSVGRQCPKDDVEVLEMLLEGLTGD